jgi:hypothetical protein
MYLLDPLFDPHNKCCDAFFIAPCVTTLHTCTPLLIFVWLVPPLPICGLLLVTFVSCIISPCTHELPPMIFVLCIATLHRCGPPLMIFVFLVVPLRAPECPQITFVSCIVTPHTLYPFLETFVFHVETTFVVQRQT